MNLSDGIKQARLLAIPDLIGNQPLLEIFSSEGLIASGPLPFKWLTSSPGGLEKSGTWEVKAVMEGTPFSYRISGNGEFISGDASKISLTVKQGQSVIVDRFSVSEV